MSEMVFVGDDEGMCEAALAGSPGLHLCAGHGCEEEDERSRERSGSTRCQLATVTGPFRELPDDCHENPDERKVRIAVSHRLVADLNNPGHRSEDDQKPKPAKRQPGSAPPVCENQRSEQCESRSDCHRLHDAQVSAGMRICL